MIRRAVCCFFLMLLATVFVSVARGEEFSSRYTTIQYDDDGQLQRFDKRLSFGSLSYLLSSQKALSVQEEVSNKIDTLIEKAEIILEMFPETLRFSVKLVASEEEVQEIYFQKYGKRSRFIAFYSPRDKVVYTSVADVKINVLAHEFAHAVIDHYFDVAPSVKIHELLAQYVEVHILDE